MVSCEIDLDDIIEELEIILDKMPWWKRLLLHIANWIGLKIIFFTAWLLESEKKKMKGVELR